MKGILYRSVLLSLAIFQTIPTVTPQLSNNISKLIENVAEQTPPSSSQNSVIVPPQTSSTPSNPPPPALTSDNQITLSPTQAAPTIATTTTTTTSQTSSEKPTTTQQQPDNTTPPVNNNTPETPTNPATTTKAEKPATPNNKNTPASPSSSSTSPSGGSKSKNNRPPGSTGDASLVDKNLPSAIDSNNNSNTTIKSNDSDSSGSKTGVIVGAVVGSIFGLALIGGLLTWASKRSCCKGRNGNSSKEYEDYGLADTDFPDNQPQMRSPGMQSIGLTANTSSIGMGSNAPILGSTPTPTIPRLNDQGTFYGGSMAQDSYGSEPQYVSGYPSQPDANSGINGPSGLVDYGNTQPMMDYNLQQAYYYPQSQDNSGGVVDPNQGYYDESNYYYDNNNVQSQQPMQTTAVGHNSNPSYDMNTQYNNPQLYMDQNSYHPTMSDDRYYKPDQIDNMYNQRI